MQDAFGEQIKHEMYSAYLYLSMSAWFEDQDLPGFAHWMKAQFIEEQTHALKMFDYVADRDGIVTLQAIAQPPSTWASALEVFQKVLEHEKHVTQLITNLFALSVKEGDFTSQQFLNWFLNEQVEEEKNADLIVARLESIGNMKGLLVMFDGHMEERKASLSV
jgi:ferritin